MENINKYIQFTDVRPDMTKVELIKHCEDTLKFGFNAAMVAPCWAELATDILKGSDSHVATCFSFPDGNETTSMKKASAEALMNMGVFDFDFTSQTSYLLSGMFDEYFLDLKTVADISADGGAQTKVIIEFGMLDERLRKIGAELAVEAGINYLKQSSGYINGIPAVPEDIQFLKKITGTKAKVKASGKINSYEKAVALINAGASLLGTSSAVSIAEWGTDEHGAY